MRLSVVENEIIDELEPHELRQKLREVSEEYFRLMTVVEQQAAHIRVLQRGPVAD